MSCLSVNTSRVKHLVLEEATFHDSGQVRPHALEALSSSSLPTIFPKLRILEVGATFDCTDTCIPFLGPQLRHLIVRCRGRHTAVSIMSAAVERCHHLRVIDLRLSIRKLALTAEIATNWSKVRSFACVGALGQADTSAKK